VARLAIHWRAPSYSAACSCAVRLGGIPPGPGRGQAQSARATRPPRAYGRLGLAHRIPVCRYAAQSREK
jgi:hypothetical protein